MEDIIYFELNNWRCGRDYPDAEPFISWMGNDFKLQFRNEKWLKEQKLCVAAFFVDMSQNFCITAPKSWVEENCPELLTKYTQFIVTPDEDEEVISKFGYYFLPYKECNYGLTWLDLDDEN